MQDRAGKASVGARALDNSVSAAEAHAIDGRGEVQRHERTTEELANEVVGDLRSGGPSALAARRYRDRAFDRVRGEVSGDVDRGIADGAKERIDEHLSARFVASARPTGNEAPTNPTVQTQRSNGTFSSSVVDRVTT